MTPQTRSTSVKPLVIGIFIGLVALAVLVCGLQRWVPLPGQLGDLASVAWSVAGSWTWLVSLVVAIVAVALVARRRRSASGRSALTTVASVLAVAALVVSSQSMGSMMWAASRAGGAVNPLTGLGVSGPATPSSFETVGQSNDGVRLRAYLWRATTGAGARPTIVHINGTALVAGASSLAPDAAWWTAQGFTVVSLDYTISTPTRAGWNKAPGDVACGLARLAANAEAWNIDTTRLVLHGDSLGGTMALTLGADASSGTAKAGCAAAAGPVPTVKAVIASNPVLDPVAVAERGGSLRGTTAAAHLATFLGGAPAERAEAVTAISPVHHASADSPPALVLVGASDQFVPADLTTAGVAQLRDKGARVTTVDVPAAGHVIDGGLVNNSPGSQFVRSVSRSWLAGLGVTG